LSADRDTPATTRLRDGRILAYAEAGPPGGFPVISCHGTPSCRLPGGWAAAADAVGARFIQPDRPGYGQSDFNPDHSLLEWARDVAELADSLGLGRFAVVGTSGGGPYAAVCGYALPERLSALALVCGCGPFWDVPEVDACATAETGSWIRELVDLARNDPEAAVAHAREECEQDAAMLERDPAEWLQFWFENDDMPDGDREIAARPEVREWSFAGLEESLRGGIEGYVQDELVLTVRPWGFRAEEISVPTSIWHGEQDTLAPVGGARYLAATIPDCRAHFFPDEGHSIPFRHGEEILQALAGAG
jgi:pimeloyl-ACP methyl ester carboxylesterase